MAERQIDLRERELDYWMTRAYEAEGKLWKAEARIKAVRGVHWADKALNGHTCAEDGHDWPCPTVRALDV